MKEIILRINYEKKADKFLQKNSTQLTRENVNSLIIKAVRKLTGKKENIDLVKMKGEFEGYLRIRKGELRIIFNVIEDEDKITVTIVNIDFRGNVYK